MSYLFGIALLSIAVYSILALYFSVKVSMIMGARYGCFKVYFLFLVYVMNKVVPEEINRNIKAKRYFLRIYCVYRAVFGFVFLMAIFAFCLKGLLGYDF